VAFTYSLGTNRGQVRLRIGDTIDRGNESLTDAEVDHALVVTSTVDVAAVWACRFLIAKLRILVTQSVKGISSNIRERVENTKALLGELKEAAGEGDEVEGYFEGVLKSENQVNESDTDFVGTMFDLGMDDNTGGSGGGEADGV